MLAGLQLQCLLVLVRSKCRRSYDPSDEAFKLPPVSHWPTDHHRCTVQQPGLHKWHQTETLPSFLFCSEHRPHIHKYSTAPGEDDQRQQISSKLIYITTTGKLRGRQNSTTLRTTIPARAGANSLCRAPPYDERAVGAVATTWTRKKLIFHSSLLVHYPSWWCSQKNRASLALHVSVELFSSQ